MKFKITYVNVDTSPDHDVMQEIVSEFEFDSSYLNDNGFMDGVDKIVSDFENQHFVVDQGGDDDWYEFDFADGCDNSDQASVHSFGEELLKVLEHFAKAYIK